MTVVFATTAEDDVVDVLWATPKDRETRLTFVPGTLSVDGDPPPPPGIPVSVPTDQLYYWSAKWQADQAESIREIEAGNSRVFNSAADAIRWLASTDD